LSSKLAPVQKMACSKPWSIIFGALDAGHSGTLFRSHEYPDGAGFARVRAGLQIRRLSSSGMLPLRGQTSRFHNRLLPVANVDTFKLRNHRFLRKL